MKIGFIGYGNMAEALAKGLLYKGAVKAEDLGASALDQAKLQRKAGELGIWPFAQTADLIAWADWLIVAVKPYQVGNVLTHFREELKDKVVMSVAAGVAFEAIEGMIPGTRHISTTPNLPVAVGEGVLGCEAKHSLTDEDQAFLETCFGQIALVLYLPTEQLRNVSTISGCTPAYTAMFAEALIDASVKHGLGRAASQQIVYQVLAGTAAMLQEGTHPAVLKEQVCSPGGTTIKGVASLERDGFRGAVIQAIDCANS